MKLSTEIGKSRFNLVNDSSFVTVIVQIDSFVY